MALRGKCNGAKPDTEAMDGDMVGERSTGGEAESEGDVERVEVRMPV
ncbi:hypothetical protein Alches_18630 [Alicyclobacillus hesperidum subsp. aegles]|nr:hypothetical protein Alches_18630 [Alicyclobacillus hesperidum subsp. aegles]